MRIERPASVAVGVAKEIVFLGHNGYEELVVLSEIYFVENIVILVL